MATLVFSTLGTALAGPVGGAIGAIVGRQLDGTLFGPGARTGPRLRELEVSLSSYGVAIPRLHGRMRVAGAIIWATELQEHSELQGGGKGQPALSAYSYTANLAVALSSRPIAGIGRIWADGKLLRGAAGDLKTAGILRVYRGTEEQPVDPLIAASEGDSRCPAFRGLAYAVFESLDLTGFGNRIPALTFEVIADDSVRLADVLGDLLRDTSVPEEVLPLAGLTVEDSLAATIAVLAPVLPIALDAAGEAIVARLPGDAAAVTLGDPAVSVEDHALGGGAGHSRRRAGAEPQAAPVLRFLDVDRDYLPGMQHAVGRAGAGQPEVVELPAALDAATATTLVEQMARRRSHAREQIAWRTISLDRAVAPGALVHLPDRSGTWRVESWEWRDAGVELELTRDLAMSFPTLAVLPNLPFPAPADDLPAATRLVALELPWDGNGGATDKRRLVAAVSADGPNWSGAALHADRGDGQLWPLGTGGRIRAVVGIAPNPLQPASPLLLDRGGSLIVVLAAPDLALTGAAWSDLAAGANLALIGEELVQFARAEPLGGQRWRLSGLLRGCGGTEGAIASHLPDEPFALLDTRLTAIDPRLFGPEPAEVVALGRGNELPVTSPLHLAGIGLRPLTPVHPRSAWVADGGLQLSWVRRARGGWSWRDGIDVPLVEEAERYIVYLRTGGSGSAHLDGGQPDAEHDLGRPRRPSLRQYRHRPPAGHPRHVPSACALPLDLTLHTGVSHVRPSRFRLGHPPPCLAAAVCGAGPQGTVSQRSAGADRYSAAPRYRGRGKRPARCTDRGVMLARRIGAERCLERCCRCIGNVPGRRLAVR
jgi:hypothetical protein